MILKSFENVADGYKVLIVKNIHGYGVNIYDLDAEEYFGVIKIFPDINDAIKYAKKVALYEI